MSRKPKWYEKTWYTSTLGLGILGLYAVLTLISLAVSVGPEPVGEAVLVGNTTRLTQPSVIVPPVIYLYAFLGGMTYAFTSLIAKIDKDAENNITDVLKVGLRALAALPLAAGVFLLAGTLDLPTSSGSAVAGAAFLVGLYVNLTLKTLGALAERLLGVSSAERSESRDTADSGPAGGGSGNEPTGAESADTPPDAEDDGDGEPSDEGGDEDTGAT